MASTASTAPPAQQPQQLPPCRRHTPAAAVHVLPGRPAGPTTPEIAAAVAAMRPAVVPATDHSRTDRQVQPLPRPCFVGVGLGFPVPPMQKFACSLVECMQAQVGPNLPQPSERDVAGAEKLSHISEQIYSRTDDVQDAWCDGVMEVLRDMGFVCRGKCKDASWRHPCE